MPVRRVKRTKPSGRQFSIFGGAMYGMRKMRPLPRGLMLQGAGIRRRRRGRGFLDTLKNIGSKALGIARSVPITSAALGLLGQPGAASIARTLGLGMRRRATQRRSRVGGARVVRRRRATQRRSRATQRLRRVGSGLLSSLLGMAGMGRKRRIRRVGGARVVRRRYVR
jgi:hypothetical protein